jgi:hypothetical protein
MRSRSDRRCERGWLGYSGPPIMHRLTHLVTSLADIITSHPSWHCPHAPGTSQDPVLPNHKTVRRNVSPVLAVSACLCVFISSAVSSPISTPCAVSAAFVGDGIALIVYAAGAINLAGKNSCGDNKEAMSASHGVDRSYCWLAIGICIYTSYCLFGRGSGHRSPVPEQDAPVA